MASAHDSKRRSRLIRNLAVYTLFRIALVAVIALLIILAGKIAGVAIPIFVALLVSVIIALPLSMVLVSGLRARISADLAVFGSQRQANKERLQRQLQGISDNSDLPDEGEAGNRRPNWQSDGSPTEPFTNDRPTT